MNTKEESNLSVGYFFCDQPVTVEKHINNWKKLPEHISNRVEFILIDTCSNNVPQIDPGHLNLKVYRILNFVEWNYGARNLIHHVATNRWVFHSNVDHILNTDCIIKMLDLKKNPTEFYMFHRFNTSQPATSRYNLSEHPGTFLLTKEAFWMSGGIEEELCGNYGYDDSILIENLLNRGYKKVKPHDIHIKNLSLSDSSDDADFINGGTWSRDLRVNKDIYERFQRGEYKLSLKRLDYEWIRII